MLVRFSAGRFILQVKHSLLCSCSSKPFSVLSLRENNHYYQRNGSKMACLQTVVRDYHNTPVSLFWEKDIKGGYPMDTSNTSRAELVRQGLKELKKEIKLWKQEMQEKFEDDPLLIVPGEIDTVCSFGSSESLEKWVITCDSDHNEGYSKAQLTLSPSGKGLFQGNLCTKVPKDGRVKKSGYCNMRTMRARKSFKRETSMDWRIYTHLVLRVRGDGRSYIINIATAGYFDITWNDVYNYVLYTRGGPYWQETKIPFSKFFLSSKGRVQDKQHPIPLDCVTNIGISVGDAINGPFRLEVDYIGIEFDPTHTETFAYEMYNMPPFIVGV